MNLLRHPAWGRAQETYGEDPLTTSASWPPRSPRACNATSWRA
ncbi:MAG: hypothetical protein U5R31_05940 [Acidimicrobiia bacterium]|nr:hypothetical protein [Acidimicrobiia bacterium]